MLIEHCEAFSRDDICDIKDFEMDITLKDEIPVNQSYPKLPRNLYGEVKKHVNDLLLKIFIKKSNSSYSSPMVCVRKKDGSLRLCIDYRKVNAKTIPSRQPIPRIQDVIDSLKGQ